MWKNSKWVPFKINRKHKSLIFSIKVSPEILHLQNPIFTHSKVHSFFLLCPSEDSAKSLKSDASELSNQRFKHAEQASVKWANLESIEPHSLYPRTHISKPQLFLSIFGLILALKNKKNREWRKNWRSESVEQLNHLGFESKKIVFKFRQQRERKSLRMQQRKSVKLERNQKGICRHWEREKEKVRERERVWNERRRDVITEQGIGGRKKKTNRCERERESCWVADESKACENSAPFLMGFTNPFLHLNLPFNF